jgi:uncharacterized membrane protein YagU involved in acid resistance
VEALTVAVLVCRLHGPLIQQREARADLEYKEPVSAVFSHFVVIFFVALTYVVCRNKSF